MLKICIEEKRFEKILYQNINIHFKGYGLYAFVGRSGCGKSTLLNIIANLDQDYIGRIEIGGTLLDHPIVNQSISYALSTNYLMNDLTVNQFILMHNIQLDEKMKEELLDFDHHLKIKNLSRGQMQRLSVSMCIAQNKDILLCDEITSGLDDDHKEKVMKYLVSYSINHLVIMVDHDLSLMKQYALDVIEINSNIDRVYDQVSLPLVRKERNLKNFDKQVRKYKRGQFVLLYSLLSFVLVGMILFYFTSTSIQRVAVEKIKGLFPEDAYSIEGIDLKEEDFINFQDQFVYLCNDDLELLGIQMEENIYSIDDYSNHIRSLEKGSYPVNDEEIVIGKKVEDILDLHIGDDLTLVYQKEDQQYSFIYNIVGISTGNEIYFKEYGEYHRLLEQVEVQHSYAIIYVNNEDTMVEELQQSNYQYMKVGDYFLNKVASSIEKMNLAFKTGGMICLVVSLLVIMELIFTSIQQREKIIGYLYLNGYSKRKIFSHLFLLYSRGIFILNIIVYEIVLGIVYTLQFFQINLVRDLTIQYYLIYLFFLIVVLLMIIISLQKSISRKPLEIIKGMK